MQTTDKNRLFFLNKQADSILSDPDPIAIVVIAQLSNIGYLLSAFSCLHEVQDFFDSSQHIFISQSSKISGKTFSKQDLHCPLPRIS
jgi:hypothetical protein